MEDRAFDREQIAARITQLREEIVSSEGGKLRAELAAVARMYRLLNANEREMREHFHRYKEPQALLELWDARYRERFDAFLDETDRLLHNYLAAAASLADHTRRLWKKYPPQDPELNAEYENRVNDTFRDSPLARFIKGLRNMSLHRKLPVIQGQMSVTGGTMPRMNAVTVLHKDDLLSWEGWTNRAKAYLAQAGDSIDVEEAIAEYTRSVHVCNDWFGKVWVGAHLPAFDAMYALVQEHDDLVRKIMGGDPFGDLRPS